MLALLLAILALFLFTPLWQAWPGGALAALFYWLGLHMYRYPDGPSASTTRLLGLAVALLATTGILRGHRRDRLARHRRRLGRL
jgi:hypothetical protein